MSQSSGIRNWTGKKRNSSPEVRISLVSSVPAVSGIRPGDLYVIACPRGSGLVFQHAVVPSWQASDLYPEEESDSPFYVSYLSVSPQGAVHQDLVLRELLSMPLYFSSAEDGKRRKVTAPKSPESCGILDVDRGEVRGEKDALMQVYRNWRRKLCLILQVEQYKLLAGVAAAAAAVEPDYSDF